MLSQGNDPKGFNCLSNAPSCRFPFLLSLRAAGGSREAALLVRKVDDMTGENEETDRARRDVSGSPHFLSFGRKW